MPDVDPASAEAFESSDLGVAVLAGATQIQCRTVPATGMLCSVVDPDPIDIASDRHDAAAVERLLRALPEWFGLEDPLVQYVRDAEHMPTYLASDHETGDVVGALLIRRHYPESAELHLMAVDPKWHRGGVGRALVDAAEHELMASGVRVLQVKTLGPSDPDEHYARTLAFYRAMGFVPLEEFSDFWPGNPCLILVKTLATSG